MKARNKISIHIRSALFGFLFLSPVFSVISASAWTLPTYEQAPAPQPFDPVLAAPAPIALTPSSETVAPLAVTPSSDAAPAVLPLDEAYTEAVAEYATASSETVYESPELSIVEIAETPDVVTIETVGFSGACAASQSAVTHFE